MSSSKRFVLRVPVVIGLLLSTFFLYSCSIIGGGSELSSDVPVDSSQRANPGKPRDNTPLVLQVEQPGTLVKEEESKALLDYSNAADGYICALSYLEGIKVKVLVSAPDGAQYQYTITSTNSYITIPLSRGNGTYSVNVYENTSGDYYAGIFSEDVDVELKDELTPFLYPNQYVDFAANDQTVQLSEQVTQNATSEVEAVDQIYMYVVQNISYDYDKINDLQGGYLPKNDDTLRTKDGICFDFAVLAASMLRAQRLPTKLDIGYCGQAYHAWIEVYTTDKGWVRKKIEFPGDAFVRMDPTFDSADKGRGDIDRVIGDGKNYKPMFYY